jgi:hypothetical protein
VEEQQQLSTLVADFQGFGFRPLVLSTKPATDSCKLVTDRGQNPAEVHVAAPVTIFTHTAGPGRNQ